MLLIADNFPEDQIQIPGINKYIFSLMFIGYILQCLLHFLSHFLIFSSVLPSMYPSLILFFNKPFA